MNSDLVKLTSAEYLRLLDCEKLLACLKACGVNNWEGYSEAIQMMKEEEDDE